MGRWVLLALALSALVFMVYLLVQFLAESKRKQKTARVQITVGVKRSGGNVVLIRSSTPLQGGGDKTDAGKTAAHR